MTNSFPNPKKISEEIKNREKFSLFDNLLVGETIFLVCFLVFITLWDDYTFYKVNYKEKYTKPVKAEEMIVSARDFDEIAKLLDERQMKFEEILKVK